MLFWLCAVGVVLAYCAIAGTLYGAIKNSQDVDADAGMIAMCWPLVLLVGVPVGLCYAVFDCASKLGERLVKPKETIRIAAPKQQESDMTEAMQEVEDSLRARRL